VAKHSRMLESGDHTPQASLYQQYISPWPILPALNMWQAPLLTDREHLEHTPHANEDPPGHDRRFLMLGKLTFFRSMRYGMSEFTGKKKGYGSHRNPLFILAPPG